MNTNRKMGPVHRINVIKLVKALATGSSKETKADMQKCISVFFTHTNKSSAGAQEPK